MSTTYDRHAGGEGSENKVARTKAGRPAFSLEVFPPRSVDAERQLSETLASLMPLGPLFVSVTYGAGGADRERSTATIARIKRMAGVVPAAHLTCAGQSRQQVLRALQVFASQGVRHIVALRGDAPANGDAVSGGDESADVSAVQDFNSALDLVRVVKAAGTFEISVAAYPEPHPKSESAEACLDALVAKFDAGADRAITQFFFNSADFLRLRDALAARGIDKPLVPGILPIHDIGQVRRFARRCGARVPSWLSESFDRLKDDADMARLFALSFTVDQVDELAREGVDHVHLYTLNRHELVRPILELSARGLEGRDLRNDKVAGDVLALRERAAG